MTNKVLVVDDEKLIVKGIKFSLEQDGMEVTAAYDGRRLMNWPCRMIMTLFCWM